MYQTSSIRGKAGEVLSFGAWAKADSISLSTSAGRNFSIKISLTRNDDSIQIAEYPYNVYVEDWQYAAGYIKADSDFKSVKMSLVYANNLNTAYFDGIQLHLEGFGDSYSYDDNGNLNKSVQLDAEYKIYARDEKHFDIIKNKKAFIDIIS